MVPGRRAKRRTIALLAFAMLPAAMAHAQSSVSLVSNQSTSGSDLASTNEVAATSFRTGNNPTGYTLSSARLWPWIARTAAQRAGSGTWVTIKEDNNGEPGNLLAGLDDGSANWPSSFTPVWASFTAPANTVLQPNTTYWVVTKEVATDEPGYEQQFATVFTDDEDSGGLTGWTIGNAYVRKTGGSWGSGGDNRSLSFGLRGYANAPLPTVSVSDASAVEGSSAEFTVTLSEALSHDVTVGYSTANGTATAGSDYTAASSKTLTVTAGDTTGPITVDTTQDEDDEATPETFTLTLSSPSPSDKVALGSAVKATGTIYDDDSSELTLSPASLSVTENKEAEYTVALATVPSETVTVTITPEADSGLTPSHSKLTFTSSDWSQKQTVTLTAADDADASGATVTVTHSAAGGNYKSVTGSLTVTVIDDDGPGIELSPTSLSMNEGASAAFTVKLETRPTATVTLDVSGHAGTDLTVTPAQLEFAPADWDTPLPVTVAAATDPDLADDEHTLTWTGSGGDYAGVNIAMKVTVVDTSTPGIVLTPDFLQVLESDTATSTYTVRLATVPNNNNDVTVEIRRSAAPNQLRFIAGSGIPQNTDRALDLTFTATNWNVPQTVTVRAHENPNNPDTAHSDTFSLIHDAEGGGYVQVPDAILRTFKEDDDIDFGYQFSSGIVTIEEGGTGSYTVRPARRPSSNVTVAVEAPGNDLTFNPSSLTFTPDNWFTYQTVNVTAAGSIADADGQFILTHTGTGGGYTEVAAGEKTVRVDRNEASVSRVRVTSTPLHTNNTYAQGETITVAVTFDADVTLDTTGGTPTLQVNFNPPSPTVERDFAYVDMTGNRTLNFSHTVGASDRDDNGLAIPANALKLNGATIETTANQRDAVISNTQLSTRGGHRVRGDQTLDAARLSALALTAGGSALTLSPTFAGNTRAYTASFEGSLEQVTVAATGAEGGSVTITPADADTQTAGHQVALTGNQTVITVTASRSPRPDGAYTLTLNREIATVTIASSVSQSTMYLENLPFTVTRTPETAAPLTVNIEFEQTQSFLASNKLTRTVTIAANQSQEAFRLSPDDYRDNVGADGTLTASIATGLGYEAGSADSVSVAMNATNPALNITLDKTSYEFLENAGNQTIAIRAETAAGVPRPTNMENLLLVLRATPDTATRSVDYTFLDVQAVTIPATGFVASGDRFVASAARTLGLTDDNDVEGSETLEISISSGGAPPGAAICSGSCSSLVTIVDDDSPPPQVTGVTLTPGQASVTVNWTSVLGAEGYKVQWKSGAETFATAAADSREATISSGSTTSHTISGLTDGTSYDVRVIATRSGVDDGTPSAEVSATPGVPTITIADASAAEGSAVVFTVSLEPAASASVTVQYSTADGTATSDSQHADGADYTPASNATLTIAAGQTSGTISIATGDDTVDEGDENFTLTLSSPSSNAVLGSKSTATGTIENDDRSGASITSAAFTSQPADGVYNAGDVIELSLTFDQAVDVTGSPRVALLLDGTAAANSYAVYDASASTDTVLAFRRTVTVTDDDDGTGIGVAANALELNGGTILNKDTSIAANLAHAAASGPNLRTRLITGIAVTSTPAVSTPSGIYGPGENVDFTVTFSESVSVNTGNGTPALSFIASDGARQEAAYRSGSNSTALVFRWTVPADVPGNESAISVPSNTGTDGALLTDRGLILKGGQIRDSDSAAVNLRHASQSTSVRADTTAPALISGAGAAVVDGDELTLTFERASGVAEHLDPNSLPATGDFIVLHDGSRVAQVSSVAIQGAKLTLTLDSAIGHGHADVRVQYTPNPSGSRIRDLWGNDAPGISARAVRNDSPEPVLSVADLSVGEGAGNAVFTVSLDVESGEALSVDYATSAGSATAGSDYTETSGTLNIAAGDDSGTVSVPIGNDRLEEEDETFTLTLSNASNASIGTASATATITDNDTPRLTVADATATEGSAVVFTVSLGAITAADVTVEYATADVSATAGADYTAAASDASLTIAAGQTSGTISIDTLDDSLDEGDETFTLTLSNPSSNAVLGNVAARTATGTIDDDDELAPAISSVAFTSVPASGSYGVGDTIEVSVTFDKDVAVTGTPRMKLYFVKANRSEEHANYVASASTARVLVFRRAVVASDDDETAANGGSLRAHANGLELNGGTILKQGSDLAANLSHAIREGPPIRTRVVSGITITSSAAVTTPPGIYAAGETIEFTVAFSETVTVDTTGGTPVVAFRVSDAAAASGGVQSAAYVSGSNSRALVFRWTVPSDVPGNETGIRALTNVGSGGALRTAAGLVHSGALIRDANGRNVNIRHDEFAFSEEADTTPPSLAATDDVVVDGAGLTLGFERRAGVAEHLDPSSEPAASDFAVTVAGSARAVTDVAVSGASVTLTLASAVLHGETVTLSHTSGSNPIEDLWGNSAGSISTRSVRNDTPEPGISVQDVTAVEDAGTLVFTVSLSAATTETVSVDYATADGTAVAGSDYTSTSGSLTFATGEISKTVSVSLTDDSVGEGSENFTLTLSNQTNASLARATATGTITDDETPTLTIANASATEGSAVVFTVTLSPAAATDVTVNYAATNGTATSDTNHEDGADYTAPASSASLTIDAGQTSATISIATGDDTVHEVNETFTITLSNPSSPAVLGAMSAATGTITNNDAASTDATLTSLSVQVAGSNVALTPSFVSTTYSYAADVDQPVTSVVLNAVATDAGASVSIAGDDDTSTPNVANLDMAYGANSVTVTVTAQDGQTTQDYVVTVTRAAPYFPLGQ